MLLRMHAGKIFERYAVRMEIVAVELGVDGVFGTATDPEGRSVVIGHGNGAGKCYGEPCSAAVTCHETAL